MAAGGGDGPRPAFCAAGGDWRPGQAEGFGRCAKERLHFPAHGRLHEYLELRCMTSGLGVHAVARRSFACGELVLSEDALLRVPDTSQEAGQRLQNKFGDRAPFLAPALGVQWDRVSKEELKSVLNLFFVHPSVSRSDTKQAETNLIICKDLLEGSEKLKSRLQPMDLLRFLHIVDLNIHRDDEKPEMACFAGIFVFGSKFSHSCAPNCSWSFSPEGRLQYHAVRPIEADEVLTFSYIGNGMNLLTSTIERRRRLSTLWFVCQCARCKGPDLSRKIRCPRCGVDGSCLPTYGQDPNWDTGMITPQMLPDAEHWHCGSCSANCPSAEMPLQEESELARLVPGAMMQGRSEEPGSSCKEATRFEQLRARAAASVGTRHWTHTLSGFAFLQRSLVQLKSDPVILHTEAEFQAVSVEIAEWLKANASANAEQRLSAMFVAVRLEHDLGGGLRAWGYDPIDPLGGGLNSAMRLREHGWEVTPEGSMRSKDDQLSAVENTKVERGL